MRVVVDTNVVVSGIFWRGAPYRLLCRWVDGRIDLFATAEILEEYIDVIDRLAATCNRADLADRWKIYLFEHVKLVQAVGNYTACRDPDDNKFVTCALSVDAEYLVSGDDDLLVLRTAGSVTIVAPADFLRLVGT